MRLIIFSDLELTRDRLAIAEPILKELFSHVRLGDKVVFTGDMWREYNAVTERFAKKILAANLEDAWFLVGNHDREIGTDRLSAAFDMSSVFDVPDAFEKNGVWFAFLPAPDRAAFGASRRPEGRKARDAALSEALEAALISLETQIGPENLGRAILFFHGAVSGEEVAPGQIAAGLTWTIPAARLSRWGLAIGGHIHKPSQHGNVYSVGGIANWTFSDRAEQFRALVVEIEDHWSGLSMTGPFKVSEIPLLRVLVPIELTLDEEGLHGSGGVTIQAYDRGAVMGVLEACGVNLDSDTVSLKIKARLPQHEMALVPKAEDLQEAINNLVERRLIQNCIITREVTGFHKVRLTTEQSAREMTLDQMLDLYVETTGNGTAPETVVAAKDRIERIADYYKPGAGTFGFEPISLELVNFRQWAAARLDFADLLGAVSVWGENESGKTNLLEAIMFALFKRSPTSTSSLEDELRLGATTGDVELAFRSRDREYLIRRALERGKGGVSCKTELLTGDIYHLGGVEPVCETSGDIEKRIAELVGSYEFFLSTVFRAGRDLNRLIVATPAVWHKIFMEALNLDCYEPLRKHADENAKNAALWQSQTAIRIEEAEKQLTDERAAFDAVDLDDLTVRIAGLAKQIAEGENKRSTLDTERSALIDRRAVLRTAANTRANLETSIREAKRALEKIIVEDIGNRPETPALDIETLERRAGELKARREELLEADQAKCREINQATAEIENCEYKLKGITSEIEILEAKIKGFEANQGKLEEPPCLKVLGPSLSIRGECPAWLYYSKADQGKEFQDKIGATRERRFAETKLCGAAVDRLSALSYDLEPITAELAALVPALREIETQIGDYRNAMHAAELWDERAKSQARATEQRETRAREVLELTGQLAALSDNGAEISETLLAIERTENKIGAQDGIIKAARAAAAEAEAEVAKRKSIAERIEKLGGSIEEHKKDIEKHAADQTAWLLIAEAFHHTGIPYLLMEKVIGSFERTANEFLDGTGMTIQVQTVTPTKKAEARDKLTVLFTDDRGQHSISQASGEQGTLLSIVLSAALSITGSQFWGAVPSLTIQDEGWGTLDAGHLETARGLIARIASQFTRFLYITHTEALAESADVQLRVVAEGGVSRLVG